MALTVSYVSELSLVVPQVVSYLTSSSADRDIFASDVIVVPNAGVRAWLQQKIASTVGTTPGEADGIATNIDIGYLGMIRQLAGQFRQHDDPWRIESLTFAVLECLPGLPESEALARRYGGMLRAARAVADMFDVYHARRPQMIDAWEKGNAALAPELGTQISAREWKIVQPALDSQDMWQFNLWTKVRKYIGVSSPPAQINEVMNGLTNGTLAPSVERLLMVGLQALDVRTIQLLQVLSAHIPIEVVLVHPSPALQQKWESDAREYNGANGAGLLRPKDAQVEDEVHPLLSSWLQSSREAQLILGTFGIYPSCTGLPFVVAEPTRLQHLKHCIASEPHVSAISISESDTSIQIHRTHELSRQVEVLHDALLHAFDELPNLEPHEIVILCADMQTSAPILQSIFGREVQVSSSDGTIRNVTIPLVVADRGLREVSEGAELLSAILETVSSRASRTSVMSIFTAEAVLSNLSLTREACDLWNQLLDRTGMKWGFNASHRAQQGFVAEAGDTYSWLATVHQALIGVLLPDAKPGPELGGIIPLDNLDTADVDAISALSYLVSLMMECEVTARIPQSVSDWCLHLEKLLVDLCGVNSDVITEPLSVLRAIKLSSSVAGNEGPTASVPFDEFASIAVEYLDAMPGRQPLRTGAVTATSFVPLRSVPFRVVCVLGYDDAVVSAKEIEGDDLTGRQRFIGSPDSRIEARRTFLDAMLAASDLFIVTCVGKSIKNNAPVPFVTPLAEFVDMCLDADASTDERDQKQSRFVFDHPRHAMSSNNFISDKVVPGKIWGHSQASFTAGLALGASNVSSITALTPFNVDHPEYVTIDELVKVLDYPEDFFMNTIGVSKWSDKVQADTALLPIEIDTRRLRELWNELRELSETTPRSPRRTPKKFASEDEDAWKSTKTARGAIPVGVFGEEALNRAKKLLTESSKLVTQWGFPSMVETKRDVSLELPHGVVAGSVSYFETEKMAGFVSLYGVERLRSRAAVLLLLLAAQGIVKHSVIVFGYDAKADETKVNNVYFADELTQEDAIRRLSILNDAIRIARSVPAVQFGGTKQAIFPSDASRQGAQSPEFAFDRFVSSDEYGKSLERRLFGEEPRFSDIFFSQSPLLSFWTTLKQAVDGPKYKSFAKHGITNIRVSGFVVK